MIEARFCLMNEKGTYIDGNMDVIRIRNNE